MSDGGIFDVGDLESLHLTPQLKMMTMAFASIPDERTRHKQLLYMASKLPNVDDDVRVSENKVPGCLSQVYVDCTATRTRRGGDDDDANVNGENDATMDGGNDDVWVVEYRGDSDGLLTKGLLALLVRGLNGCTPDEIDAIDPKFVTAARISQTLTPGRNNGFLNMLAVMKRKAREAVDRANVEGGGGSVDGDERASDSSTTATASNAMTTSGGPMYNAILAILSTSLKPKSIVLVDESHKHAGHAGSKGFEGGESHFSLNIVSDAFEGLNLVKRHKLIYVLLGDVMPRIHALAIVARSTSEVE
jgi:sulfur transfer protein SufE/stress-induced morphogen